MPSSSILPGVSSSMPTKAAGGAVAKSYGKSSYKTKSRDVLLDADKTESSSPPSSSSSPPSTAASASAALGTVGGGIPVPGGGVDLGTTGGGGDIGGDVRANASTGRSGAASGVAGAGLSYGAPGGMMKGASGRGIVDGGGGGDRRGKTYAKSSLKGFAAANNAGPVGGGYLTDLSGKEASGIGGATMNGGDVSTAAGVGGNSSVAPPGAVGEVGAGGGGVLKGTTGAAAVSGSEKGYFGKASTPKLFGKSNNNVPPSPFGGGEGGGGMYKTTVGGGFVPEKSPAISMANVMKGWTRESRSGSRIQSTSSDGDGGDGYLPGLVQSRAVIITPAGPSLLAPEGSSTDQRPASRTSMGVPRLPATAAEEVAVISKEEQLAQKLEWLQAPVIPVPQQQQQQIPPLQQQQIPPLQQQRPQPIGQFGTSTRNTARIGSATRLGSLASFGVAVQGLDNQGGRGVPAGDAAAVSSVETPTAVGGGGEGDDGARRPLSVTITDPRTGKKRTITASKNPNP
jgi:hypothetical protein